MPSGYAEQEGRRLRTVGYLRSWIVRLRLLQLILASSVMGALGWLDDGAGSFDRVALVAEGMGRLGPFQLFGPNDGPRIRREHGKGIFEGIARASWNGTRAWAALHKLDVCASVGRRVSNNPRLSISQISQGGDLS